MEEKFPHCPLRIRTPFTRTRRVVKRSRRTATTIIVFWHREVLSATLPRCTSPRPTGWETWRRRGTGWSRTPSSPARSCGVGGSTTRAAGSPVILTCWNGDDLLGGAALEIDRIGRGAVSVERVRMLGQGGLAPDHLDVVARPADRSVVARMVLDWIGRPGSRLVDLDGLAAGGALAHATTDHVIDRIGAPWTPLDVDAAGYVAGLPGQLRNTIKRAGKRFTTAGATIAEGRSRRRRSGPWTRWPSSTTVAGRRSRASSRTGPGSEPPRSPGCRPATW